MAGGLVPAFHDARRKRFERLRLRGWQLRQVAAVIAFTVFTPVLATGPTTGALEGVVYDSAGALLGDAKLVLSGPQLLGSRSTLTSQTGEFRFAYLLPDDRYRLEVSRPGFQTIVIERIKVSLGRAVTIRPVVRPSITDAIEVEVAPQLIDTSSPTISTTVTAEMIEAFPTHRDFQYLAILAPGVRFDRDLPILGRNGAQGNPTFGGATFLENDYIIEGISTRSVRWGISATNLTMNYVQEVQILSGALSAEYGRAIGGVINVLTKSGGNTIRGDLVGYVQDADWTAREVSVKNGENVQYAVGHDKYDLGLSIGFPIVRDRLWFFGSYAPRHDRYIRDLNSPGISRREPIDSWEWVYAAKLTANVNARTSLTLSGFGNPVRGGGWMGDAYWDESAAWETFKVGSDNLAARVDSIYRSWSIDGIIGVHRTADRILGDPAPYQEDELGVHGGPAQKGSFDTSRSYYALRSSMYRDKHDLRFGAELERDRGTRTDTIEAYGFCFNCPVNEVIGSRNVINRYFADNSGFGSNETLAAFVQDQWRLSPDVVATLGMRWERQTARSARGVTVATNRLPDGSVESRSASDFTFRDGWAPRLGLVWDPSGLGRTRIYGSAGRFHAAVPVDIYVLSMSGYVSEQSSYYSLTEHPIESWWNPDGSPLDADWIQYSSIGRQYPEVPSPVDPGTGLQYQDEYAFGWEQALGKVWKVGARFVQREIGDVIEDLVIWNPEDPTRRTGYIIGNPSRTDYAPGLRAPARRHQSLELTLERRLHENWQMVASFVSARARGNYDGYYQYSTFSGEPGLSYAFDRPRWMENSYGKLRSDIPYQFKIHSSYAFPFGLTLSEGFMYSAGTPISARVAAFPDMIYFKPRGSEGRTPDYWFLDLHAAWSVSLPVRHPVEMTLITDVFNVTNNHEALDVNETYANRRMPGGDEWFAPDNLDEFGYPRFREDLPANPYFKSPRFYQTPRSVQVGLKVSF